jgi:hypothetical protein
MIDAGLSTTPAEEVPHEGFDRETGEVIEAAPVESVKIPGITKIKDRLRAMKDAGDSPEMTLDAFRALVRANKDDLKTIRDANHGWWTGDGEDFEGYGPWIERRKAELASPDAGMCAELIRSMKQCDTKPSLDNWYAANEAVIEALDGADGRSFELAYQLHESAIREMDRVTAGA